MSPKKGLIANSYAPTFKDPTDAAINPLPYRNGIRSNVIDPKNIARDRQKPGYVEATNH